MLPTAEEQKIADLTIERTELLDLLSAAYVQLNAYWQGDFAGRPIAKLMHDKLSGPDLCRNVALRSHPPD